MKPIARSEFRRVLIVLAAAAMSAAVPAFARAQDFSARTIRIIVSAAAAARPTRWRAWSARRSLRLAHDGAGGEPHRRAFRAGLQGGRGSPPDGFTLFMSPTSAVIAQFAPPRDRLRHAARLLAGDGRSRPARSLLVARKDIPIKSIADLIAYDRKVPGKVIFGSGGGTGSSFYLALELLKLNTGINPVMFPIAAPGPRSTICSAATST